MSVQHPAQLNAIEPTARSVDPAPLPYPTPIDEDVRLQALYSYNILDTPDEDAFDRITRLAARLLNIPASLINLIDIDRQWTKARFGVDATVIPRAHSFCTHTIVQKEVLVVEDARLDPRFAQNPLVLDGSVIFYAGAPLATSEGYHLGALCVIDTQPAPF